MLLDKNADMKLPWKRLSNRECNEILIKMEKKKLFYNEDLLP